MKSVALEDPAMERSSDIKVMSESSLESLNVEFNITESIWKFAIEGCEERVVEM
jgi:LysM repeat protein